MGAASRKRETAAAPTPVFIPTNGQWSLELDSNLVLKAFMIYFWKIMRISIALFQDFVQVWGRVKRGGWHVGKKIGGIVG